MINKIFRYLCKDSQYTNMQFHVAMVALAFNISIITIGNSPIRYLIGLGVTFAIMSLGSLIEFTIKQKLEKQDGKA